MVCIEQKQWCSHSLTQNLQKLIDMDNFQQLLLCCKVWFNFIYVTRYLGVLGLENIDLCGQ